MPLYHANISTPDELKSFFSTIQEVAGITKINEDNVMIEFEEEDEYALATRVFELTDELAANGWKVEIPRPRAAGGQE